ncbi:mechanosensitive ion channel family protein (plasmid) [Pseudorhodobacter turbinis]|uniref:Mechanosensitive ion channel family protein n=1 Tax=Pseudorhodobacter turbinis TaxID=2500533 RepID=A0A4P8EKC9_9RHOB|nr:DUF3772 domain-containing protein [Pseudorhodobacter turbinis]QCO57671.1 mechanosensitive ion channel family protein [Pseudorhodobacter turbinis]
MIRMRQAVGGFTLFLAALALWFGIAATASAQTDKSAGAAAGESTAQAVLDYDAWNKVSDDAETKVSDSEVTEETLIALRTEIAAWRARFLAAQGVNSARIGTIRAQIEALGAPPADGVTEAADIAARRVDLAEQLSVAQAPAIAAVEAYSRADGQIGEIDAILRDRQAEALLQLWPLPINPANWPAAVTALLQAGNTLGAELTGNWADEAKRANLRNKLPPIVGLLLVALLTIFRGRFLVERFAVRLLDGGTSSLREIWSFMVSLGQVIVPILGVVAFVTAVVMSGMLGPLGAEVAQVLIKVGLIAYGSRWLGTCSFPKAFSAPRHLQLDADGRAKGRFLAQSLGLIFGLEVLRTAVLQTGQMSEAAASVFAFPMVLLTGVLLFRLGKLLLRSTKVEQDEEQDEEAPMPFSLRLIALLSQIAMVVAVLGPLLAMVGYVRAGQGLVYPMVGTLALVGLLFTLQSLVGAVYAVFARTDEQGRDGLLPVLIGFVLSFAAIPLLALIWGARMSDLTEVFTKLRDGFQIGETRISPTDFILLFVVFGFWYVVTRLLQGALKTTILPKTNLDHGGQNAIVVGVGYVGIFLAALIGITSAGMDLSGLAIVAGALSVGIGFGLQNIVLNFVSGIILLIERPISEGDWVEVNGIMGTVSSISVRSTRIQTFDRTDVIVPNSDFVSNMVTNWTRYNMTGRLIVKVGAAYGSDTRHVERVLQEIAEAQPLAVLNPPPTVVLAEFGADSLNFEIRVILRDVNFSVTVRSDINHDIARRFAEEGIEIPVAQRAIWLRNPEALEQFSAPKQGPIPDSPANS